MKKIIAGLSGLLVMIFVLMLFTNAVKQQDPAKKAGTEMSQKCSGMSCPMASKNQDKCRENGCDKKKCTEEKCDPSTCKMKSGSEKCQGKMEKKECGKDCPMAKK